MDVTARQWGWEFAYPQYHIKGFSDYLIIPVGQKGKFVLQTADVLHSFWIPAFSTKKDIMPGDTRTLFMKPTVISLGDECIGDWLITSLLTTLTIALISAWPTPQICAH